MPGHDRKDLFHAELGGELLIAALAVAQMALHSRARLLHRARADRLEDLRMLALENGEVAAAEQGARLAPHGVAWNDEAAEIFQEAAELRIAGGVGDLAMKSEVLVDRGFAALDRGIDGRETLADLLELGGRRAFGRKAGSLDL